MTKLFERVKMARQEQRAKQRNLDAIYERCKQRYPSRETPVRDAWHEFIGLVLLAGFWFIVASAIMAIVRLAWF